MTGAGRRIRVFLVDDVKELRMLVRMALEDDPEIEVVGEASTGREGVEGVAATQPDVVLLDLSMPDMDGLEAIPLMRERAPEARLVVLSGHEAGRVSLEALGQGATRYVNKAADLDTIRATVHEVARLEPPFTHPRFGVVRTMWTAFLDGAIDEVLDRADADATWLPYTAPGRRLRTRAEARAFIEELLAEGRVVDPRAYGVEPEGGGLIVRGTLEIRGPGGLSETPVFWAFCFRGPLVSLAGAFDRRDDALASLREYCPG
ncbi:MAG: response regulator [Thermoleophilaceae bacterium]